MMGPEARLLPDGRRLHLSHGPIDILFEAWGAAAEIAAARAQAAARFETILEELVAELPALRAPTGTALLAGPVARRMAAVAGAHRPLFTTPMIAVAGAVGDEILAAAAKGRDLTRAYANNGGDIALHLAPGASFEAAIATRADLPGAAMPGRLRVTAQSGVRGVATSGWRGRSRSLGIADAVTVLAGSAAEADAAATLIANAVDLPGHPAIRRAPASELDDESDLGPRPVTTAVGALTLSEARRALAAGAALARTMRAAGLIRGAALFLAGEAETVDMPIHCLTGGETADA